MVAARDFTVRRLHEGKAEWAAATAAWTSVEAERATLAMGAEVDGLSTGMYWSVDGGTCLPAM